MIRTVANKKRGAVRGANEDRANRKASLSVGVRVERFDPVGVMALRGVAAQETTETVGHLVPATGMRRRSSPDLKKV